MTLGEQSDWQRAQHLAVIFVALAAGWMCLRVAGTLDGVGDVLKRADATLLDVNRTVLVVGVTMAEVQKMATAERKSFQSQQEAAMAAEKGFGEAVTQMNLLVAHTDASLNGAAGAIPALTVSMRETTRETAALSANVQQNLTEMVGQVKAATVPAVATMESANRLVSDPALPQTLENIQQSTANLASSTKQLDESLRRDVLPYVHRLTQPTRAIVSALHEVEADVVRGFGAYLGAGAK